MDQNQALKQDITLAERKLLARNERIQSLEALLGDSQERLEQQNQKFAAQMNEIKRRLESARESKHSLTRGFLKGRMINIAA